jgi:hypothetical protein
MSIEKTQEDDLVRTVTKAARIADLLERNPDMFLAEDRAFLLSLIAKMCSERSMGLYSTAANTAKLLNVAFLAMRSRRRPSRWRLRSTKLAISVESTDPGALPEFGEKLLPFLLPKKSREDVSGDFAEDFRRYAMKWGRNYALKWLYWELAGLALKRFRPTVIVTALGMWARRKLGW